MNPQPPHKPRFGEPCNGCGYCCTVQPCQLAQEFLNCSVGPCIALEAQGNLRTCGLVRNPLTYLYKVAHPDEDVQPQDSAPDIQAGKQLSHDLAAALGIGRGCDAEDDADSAAWPDPNGAAGLLVKHA